MFFLFRKYLRWQIIIPVFLVLALIGGWGYNYYQREIKVVPDELISRALADTNKVSSYRFHVEAYLINGGKKIPLSSIDGERTNESDLHLKGQMTGQDVEVYQVKDTTYFKDPISKRWMVTPGNNPLEQEKFMAELNPLSILNIVQINDLQYLGRQKEMPGRPYLLTFNPRVNNRFLNSYWKDFSYKLWIEPGSNYIRRVHLEANHRKHPKDKLVMDVDFYDFNKRIKIELPEEE